MRLSAVTPLGSIAGESPQKIRSNPALPSSSSSSSSSLLLLLPDEITLNILARVSRRYYPWISLVCKTLNRLISSPKIYIERSITHRTEDVLHVVLRSQGNETPLWFTLNSKPFEIGNGNGNRHRLVPIPSFPSVPSWGMSIIAFESEIYILGGCGGNGESVSTAFVVKSGSNTCRFLPNMKEPRGCAAAGIIDGKLYVIGGCNRSSQNWIEAFDLETQIWETVTIDDNNNDVEMHEKTILSLVMNDKIYIMDRKKSFVYDPKLGSFETDDSVNLHWRAGSCVIDDRLYNFGIYRNKILVFDPISKVWSCVKGLEGLPKYCLRMANRGGRLVILYNVESFSMEIWCMEIELERRQGEEEEGGGEIWGKIVWLSLVLSLKNSYSISRSLAVAM